MASSVKGADGSIGYMEWSFAENAGLKMSKIGNGAGEFTALTAEAAGKTIAGAAVEGQGDDLKLKIDYNTKEAGAYPIVLATYEIVCSNGLAADKLKLVKGLLGYAASAEGQNSLTDLGYARCPRRSAPGRDRGQEPLLTRPTPPPNRASRWVTPLTARPTPAPAGRA
ncbi:substrate-binding domain-containing protein [Micromonospora sp. M12]